MEKQKKRSEIEEKYKWDISCLYASKEEIDADKDKVTKLINTLKDYKGKLTSSSDMLLNFLKLDEQISEIIYNLYVYAYSVKSVDFADQEGQKLFGEVVCIDSLYNEKSSFVMPELMKTDYSVIQKYLEDNEALREYKFDLEKMYRYQKYTLSDKEEALLANIGEIRTRTENNFEVTVNSIIKYGFIKDEDNNEVELTNGNYSKYIRSKDRRVRKDAYEAKGKALEEYTKILAIDLESAIKTDAIVAKARGYDSDIDMYLFEDGVTPQIYDNMVDIACKHLDVLHKYYRLIKKVTGINDLEIYDLSAPLTEVSNKKYTPEDAKDIIIDSLKVYGDDYISVLRKAFEERWIDYYPNEGKRVGYYQNNSYRGHPLIFGNFTDDFNSVSAICHELGHAMHTYYSNKNNPPHSADYKIIVAEVASLTNELILSNYIVNNSDNKQEKLAAIENILSVFSDNYYGTVAAGSVFERVIHKKVFDGESLTAEDINNIFEEAYGKHFGPDVKKNEYMKYSWARIPHYYTSFYYYKYSIGISCACYVASKILNGDKEFLDKYLNYLKLGDTMMPLDELKTIGIDLTKTEVLEEAIKYFDKLIDKFEEIYNS